MTRFTLKNYCFLYIADNQVLRRWRIFNCQSQEKDVAERSGIGLTTIHKFESGVADNLTLSTFILLMKAIGQINNMDNLLPELPESPYLIRKNEKKAQRIRHSK